LRQSSSLDLFQRHISARAELPETPAEIVEFGFHQLAVSMTRWSGCGGGSWAKADGSCAKPTLGCANDGVCLFSIGERMSEVSDSAPSPPNADFLNSRAWKPMSIARELFLEVGPSRIARGEEAYGTLTRAAELWREANQHFSAGVAMLDAFDAAWGRPERMLEALRAALTDFQRVVSEQPPS
jgi:hypothetical protein